MSKIRCINLFLALATAIFIPAEGKAQIRYGHYQQADGDTLSIGGASFKIGYDLILTQPMSPLRVARD
jgi:hypothetical protein